MQMPVVFLGLDYPSGQILMDKLPIVLVSLCLEDFRLRQFAAAFSVFGPVKLGV